MFYYINMPNRQTRKNRNQRNQKNRYNKKYNRSARNHRNQKGGFLTGALEALALPAGFFLAHKATQNRRYPKALKKTMKRSLSYNKRNKTLSLKGGKKNQKKENKKRNTHMNRKNNKNNKNKKQN
ncbi:MAG: hypothetical protein CMH50_13455 [Myxococcales bacterium]|nr:hypothetical protein [Myxococcales bacterium]